MTVRFVTTRHLLKVLFMYMFNPSIMELNIRGRPDWERCVPSGTPASFFDEKVPKWVKVDGIDSFDHNFHQNQQKYPNKPKSAQNTSNTLEFLFN